MIKKVQWSLQPFHKACSCESTEQLQNRAYLKQALLHCSNRNHLTESENFHMNPLKKIYCRIFQNVFKFALPFLPYRNPEIISSLKAVPDVLKKKKCKNVLIITDAGIHKLGLTDRLEKVLTDSSIPYILYDKTVANPTTMNVAEALELYHENNCQAIIGFGGGSSMDCAKAVGPSRQTSSVSCKDERNPESAQKASTSYRRSNHCRNRKRNYTGSSNRGRRNPA